MSKRLKLIVAYDGAPFAGWQSQSHRNTIQDYLERAFERVTGRPVRVHGAGRTDAGVHALAQCAHVDVNKALASARWMEALNALLPPAIRVLRCRYVSTIFTRAFRHKEKCIAIESGARLFYRRLSTDVHGTSHARSISNS